MSDPNATRRRLKSMFFRESAAMNKSAQIWVKIDKRDKDELMRIAGLKKLRMSGIVREAIREYLKNRNIHKEETK